MATKKQSRTGKNAAPVAAAALAAVAAAGAATYYFYGTKNAKKHRHAASVWAKGLKKEVQKGLKGVKKIDARTVARIVDDAAAVYQGTRGVAASDVRAAAQELKKNWSLVAKEMAPSPAVKRTVKRVTKKKTAPKKTTKKAAKKKRA
jgi:hypothetical protein